MATNIATPVADGQRRAGEVDFSLSSDEIVGPFDTASDPSRRTAPVRTKLPVIGTKNNRSPKSKRIGDSNSAGGNDDCLASGHTLIAKKEFQTSYSKSHK
jgi:hypothetical protein